MPVPFLSAIASRLPLRPVGSTLPRFLTAFTIAAALGMMLLAGLTLSALRDEVWQRAELSGRNLVRLIQQDVGRNIELFDLSIQAVMDGLDLPGIDRLDPTMRQAVLFDRAATARYLGAILVLDDAGSVVVDSRSVVPRTANFAHRDYFRHHVATVDRTLYVSTPYVSSTTGDWVIGLSRRREAQDGTFRGVVVGTMQLAYFNEIFAHLQIGNGGTVNLFRDDGVVLARKLGMPEGGATIAGGKPFRHFIEHGEGTLVSTSALDGRERLYSFARIGSLPLFVDVAVAVDDLFQGWRHRVLAVTTVVASLGAVAFALNAYLLRELRQRRAAEAALAEANEALSRLAVTDPLTGLANRRRFDAILAAALRRGERTGAGAGLILIDVDCFKAYNDRYGHQAGDDVLRMIAAEMTRIGSRERYEPCRIGGEEFAIVTPTGDREMLVRLAGDLRRAVAARRMAHAGAPSGIVTVSLGCATAASGEAGAIVAAADAALYRAKHDGRNRVRTDFDGAAPADLLAALVSLSSPERRRSA